MPVRFIHKKKLPHRVKLELKHCFVKPKPLLPSPLKLIKTIFPPSTCRGRGRIRRRMLLIFSQALVVHLGRVGVEQIFSRSLIRTKRAFERLFPSMNSDVAFQVAGLSKSGSVTEVTLQVVAISFGTRVHTDNGRWSWSGSWGIRLRNRVILAPCPGSYRNYTVFHD